MGPRAETGAEPGVGAADAKGEPRMAVCSPAVVERDCLLHRDHSQLRGPRLADHATARPLHRSEGASQPGKQATADQQRRLRLRQLHRPTRSAGGRLPAPLRQQLGLCLCSCRIKALALVGIWNAVTLACKLVGLRKERVDNFLFVFLIALDILVPEAERGPTATSDQGGSGAGAGILPHRSLCEVSLVLFVHGFRCLCRCP